MVVRGPVVVPRSSPPLLPGPAYRPDLGPAGPACRPCPAVCRAGTPALPADRPRSVAIGPVVRPIQLSCRLARQHLALWSHPPHRAGASRTTRSWTAPRPARTDRTRTHLTDVQPGSQYWLTVGLVRTHLTGNQPDVHLPGPHPPGLLAARLRRPALTRLRRSSTSTCRAPRRQPSPPGTAGPPSRSLLVPSSSEDGRAQDPVDAANPAAPCWDVRPAARSRPRRSRPRRERQPPRRGRSPRQRPQEQPPREQRPRQEQPRRERPRRPRAHRCPAR